MIISAFFMPITYPPVAPQVAKSIEKKETQKMGKSKVISVANQKGGVGKSITVYNLGVDLALDGKRVLLLDVDLRATSPRCWTSAGPINCI